MKEDECNINSGCSRCASTLGNDSWAIEVVPGTDTCFRPVLESLPSCFSFEERMDYISQLEKLRCEELQGFKIDTILTPDLFTLFLSDWASLEVWVKKEETLQILEDFLIKFFLYYFESISFSDFINIIFRMNVEIKSELKLIDRINSKIYTKVNESSSLSDYLNVMLKRILEKIDNFSLEDTVLSLQAGYGISPWGNNKGGYGL